MSDMSHLPNIFNGAETFVFNALGVNDWQSIIVPRGKSHIEIICIGSGASGAGGFSAAAATARGGSGGGGSAAFSRLILPTFILPPLMYANVALGPLGSAPGVAGLGGALSYVSLQPNNTRANLLVQSGTVAPTGGSVGTAAAIGNSGNGGTVAVASTSGPYSAYGGMVGTAGIPGGSGGAIAGGIGAAVTWGAGINISGGAGGAGTTSADFAGGTITGSGWFPTIAGGLAASRGNDGFLTNVPFGSCGGSGGGSSNAGAGGDGGNGAIGSGGGGGGSGVTGGKGGNGGHGLIIVSFW
jgi:hypothetical protein